jgi:hypothetical protein
LACRFANLHACRQIHVNGSRDININLNFVFIGAGDRTFGLGGGSGKSDGIKQQD